jgi:hypothetical protein
MNLVALDASNPIGRVSAGDKVAHFLMLNMATQTGSVGLLGGTGPKTNDLCEVVVVRHAQASWTVAVLAFDPLLGVKSMPEIAAQIGVTARARL